jgi:hypothetical protein
MRAAAIARLLPAIYQETLPTGAEDEASDSILGALLGVMSMLHVSTEDFLADPRAFIDPWRARPDFLVALARWVALAPYVDAGGGAGADIAALRELTYRAATLARHRGTAEALIAICELVTGERGFAVEEGVVDADGDPLPFHFRLVAPASAEAKRDLVAAIVAAEKPAFVTADIVFRTTSIAEEGHAELPDR